MREGGAGLGGPESGGGGGREVVRGGEIFCGEEGGVVEEVVP